MNVQINLQKFVSSTFTIRTVIVYFVHLSVPIKITVERIFVFLREREHSLLTLAVGRDERLTAHKSQCVSSSARPREIKPDVSPRVKSSSK